MIQPVEDLAHEEFRAVVLSQSFACVLGASAVRSGRYRFHSYSRLGDRDSASAVAADLAKFIDEYPLTPGHYASFAASFREPGGVTATEFEELLWQTLRHLHEEDDQAWDRSVSSDPDDAGFSFSFHGRAFFVVGMHAGSPRWTRRLAFPTLVFNAHEQFEDLRRSDHFSGVQETIRKRDTELQGSPNPVLADYGQESEARQYSGRLVPPDWRCPFTKQPDGHEN
jgi:FPC/CPF motif-containing protein YcgG